MIITKEEVNSIARKVYTFQDSMLDLYLSIPVGNKLRDTIFNIVEKINDLYHKLCYLSEHENPNLNWFNRLFKCIGIKLNALVESGMEVCTENNLNHSRELSYKMDKVRLSAYDVIFKDLPYLLDRVENVKWEWNDDKKIYG